MKVNKYVVWMALIKNKLDFLKLKGNKVTVVIKNNTEYTGVVKDLSDDCKYLILSKAQKSFIRLFTKFPARWEGTFLDFIDKMLLKILPKKEIKISLKDIYLVDTIEKK